MNYLDILKAVLPETILVLTAFGLLAADLTLRDVNLRMRFIIGAMIASAGCAITIAWICVMPMPPEIPGGMLLINPLSQAVKVGLVGLTIFTLWLSVDSHFTEHVGEYLALILLATIGMMFLVSAEDILMVFVALELTSLALYILTAFNKRNIRSAEAALKYFLFGSMSAAFLLFGLSLVYGLSGETNLQAIAESLSGRELDPLLVLAIVMVVTGFGFKVAAVPFHLWAPDAYEGAPAPSAAFIASGSKVASFFIFAKVMLLGFLGAEGSGAWLNYVIGWVPLVALVAALSMIVGNLAAIVQSSVKRLIAYSAIAHGGYALLGILSQTGEGVVALLYYVLTYGLTTIGAFGVVAAVEQGTGGDRLSDFAGLSRRSPVVAACMFVFMLSLTGIPPLAGFFGKFYVFAEVVRSGAPALGLLWIVFLAIGMSAVSLYYYLQVLKQIYVADAPQDAGRIRVPAIQQIVLCLLAIGVIVLGCAPSLLLNPLHHAIAGGGH